MMSGESGTDLPASCHDQVEGPELQKPTAKIEYICKHLLKPQETLWQMSNKTLPRQKKHRERLQNSYIALPEKVETNNTLFSSAPRDQQMPPITRGEVEALHQVPENRLAQGP